MYGIVFCKTCTNPVKPETNTLVIPRAKFKQVVLPPDTHPGSNSVNIYPSGG